MVVKTEKSTSIIEEKSAVRKALPQVLAVCVKNVLLTAFGMTLGFPTILIPNLTSDNPDATFVLGQEAISWIGSISLICVPVGCLMSGVLTQPLGRRRAMQFVNIPLIISWLIYYFSNDVWQIFLALCLHGLSGGLMEAPVLTYVAEITQPSLRGILSSTSTVAVISGTLIQFFLGTFFKWKTVALISCSAPLLSAVLLFLVPESPHWLISKKRFDDAKNSLKWLRGWTTIEEILPEYKELCKQMNKSEGIDNPAFESSTEHLNDKTASPNSFVNNLKHLYNMNFLWPFALVTFTFFLGHFSGMTTLQTYAVVLFSSLKAPIDKYYATIILGCAELLGCILSCCLVQKLGKRVLCFISLIGCGVCFAIVATYAFMLDVKYLETPATINSTTISESHNWIPTTFLIISAFCSHLGIRLLPWILIGEVYSTEARSYASGLSGAASYVLSFLSNKLFLKMISFFTIFGTFWFYSSVSIIGLIVLYFVLPETEGKTLYEITEHFSGNLKLDNKVFKHSKGGLKGQDNQTYQHDQRNESRF